MTKVTQVGGGIPQRPSAEYPDKIITTYSTTSQLIPSFIFFIFLF